MSLWRLKDHSVSLVGLAEPLAPVIPLAAAVWAKHGADELVVTSGNDGRHARTSLHYAGHALDFRTKNLPTDDAKRAAVAELRSRLNRDFDVLLEYLGETQEHCHLEWQPKRSG